jgi:hypothetical protein
MRAAALVAAALVATCCAFEPATLLLVALIGGSVAGLVLVSAGIQRPAIVRLVSCVAAVDRPLGHPRSPTQLARRQPPQHGCHSRHPAAARRSNSDRAICWGAQAAGAAAGCSPGRRDRGLFEKGVGVVDRRVDQHGVDGAFGVLGGVAGVANPRSKPVVKTAPAAPRSTQVT